MRFFLLLSVNSRRSNCGRLISPETLLQLVVSVIHLMIHEHFTSSAVVNMNVDQVKCVVSPFADHQIASKGQP